MCRRWIAGKISEILGSEDDVVIELCFNLIEGSRYVRSFLASQKLCQSNFATAGYQEDADSAYGFP